MSAIQQIFPLKWICYALFFHAFTIIVTDIHFKNAQSLVRSYVQVIYAGQKLKCSLIWSSLAHSCVEEAQATYCSNHEFMRGSQSEQSWLDGFFSE